MWDFLKKITKRKKQSPKNITSIIPSISKSAISSSNVKLYDLLISHMEKCQKNLNHKTTIEFNLCQTFLRKIQ